MLELKHVITHEEWGRGLGRVGEGGTKAEMNTFDEYNPAIYFGQKSKAIKNVKIFVCSQQHHSIFCLARFHQQSVAYKHFQEA